MCLSFKRRFLSYEGHGHVSHVTPVFQESYSELILFKEAVSFLPSPDKKMLSQHSFTKSIWNQFCSISGLCDINTFIEQITVDIFVEIEDGNLTICLDWDLIYGSKLHTSILNALCNTSCNSNNSIGTVFISI